MTRRLYPLEPLEKRIYYTVSKVDISKVRTGKFILKDSIKHADDRYLVVCSAGSRTIEYVAILGLIAVFLLTLCVLNSLGINVGGGETYSNGDFYKGMAYLVVLFFINVLLFLYIYRAYEVRLDRFTGRFVIRTLHMLKWKEEVMQFSDVLFQRRSFSSVDTSKHNGLSADSTDDCLVITLRGRKNICVRPRDAASWLSLFVWYMDKNRPLPPGSAFDLYRERDYERRKSEGFPAPLYPSPIETPEWVGAEGGDALKKYRAYTAMLQRKYKNRTSKSYGR